MGHSQPFTITKCRLMGHNTGGHIVNGLIDINRWGTSVGNGIDKFVDQIGM